MTSSYAIDPGSGEDQLLVITAAIALGLNYRMAILPNETLDRLQPFFWHQGFLAVLAARYAPTLHQALNDSKSALVQAIPSFYADHLIHNILEHDRLPDPATAAAMARRTIAGLCGTP